MMAPNEDMYNEEEAILNSHVECVKEDAQLLTEEGELITKLQTAMTNDEDYDMAEYLYKVDQVARKKMQMYADLVARMDKFRN